MIIGFVVIAILLFVAALFVYKDKDKDKKWPTLTLVFGIAGIVFSALTIIFTIVAIPLQGYNMSTEEIDLETFTANKTVNGEVTNTYSNIIYGTSDILDDEDEPMFYYIAYKEVSNEEFSVDNNVHIVNRNRDTLEIIENGTRNHLTKDNYKLKNGFFGVWFWNFTRGYTEYTFEFKTGETIVRNEDFQLLEEE